MTKRELIEYCLTYQDAYEDYPFDELLDTPGSWAVIRHNSNKKSFAMIFERSGSLFINLKCEPHRADFLRQLYPSVTPAYHMNKKHWNSVLPNEIESSVLNDMIEHSYNITLSNFKKRKF